MRSIAMADGPLHEALAVVAAASAMGVMVELTLIGHWHGIAQVAPWVVAQGSLTAAWAVVAPLRRWRLRLAQLLCAINIAACSWGAVVHLQANWAFSSELNAADGWLTVMVEALRGRIPLLAPLFLALPSVLILLVAWRRLERASA